MTPTTLPLLVHRGDAQHGVDRHAREIAAAIHAVRADAVLVAPDEVPDGARVHLHFTDRLWGGSPAEAAAAVEAIAARAQVTVTVHDVPQGSDGSASLERRAAAYRRVLDAACGVVCSSEHERALLRAHVSATLDARVVPLPSVEPDASPAPAAMRAEIGVLGYFYPGKGHAEAIEASSALRDPLPVTAIGRAAAGHEDELADLARRARPAGVEVTSTGFLDDAALHARARAALVPLVAHRHVSASGSLMTWLAAGRRPIVVRNDYFAEMDALRPGTVHLVDDDEVVDAIEHAVLDPSWTWLSRGVDVRPTADDAAREYLALWAEA